MPFNIRPKPEECNCLAVRQAARRITQFYDHCLAPSGLRTVRTSELRALLRAVSASDLSAPAIGVSE
jgi:hypothetical protein